MLSVIIILPVLLWAAYTDFRYRTISNKASVILVIVGITEIAFFRPFFPVSTIERLIVCFVFLIVFLMLYKIKPGVSGGGDLKLFASTGFCTGLHTFYILFLASIIGIIYALITRKKGGRFLSMAAPMGSCMAAGAIVFVVLHFFLYAKGV